MANIICDSSILILLSKLEMLDLLIEAFDDIIIPQAVYHESVVLGKMLKKMDALLIEKKIKDGKIKVEEINDLTEKENIITNFNIHEGESEAIVLYLEKNADLFGTDDFKTLKVCKVFNIKYFTTPLFIVRCYLNNKLTKDISILKFEKLLKIGWYKEETILEFKNKIKNLKG